jgi:hypothetical protein
MRTVSRRGSERAWGVGLVAVVASLATVSPAQAAAAKPDLVPLAAEIHGEEYTLIGEYLPYRVDFTTKNQGNKNAGPTLTRIYVQHGDKSYKLADRSIPGLDAKFQHQADERVVSRNRFPAGSYKLLICVDARNDERESNEHNNCIPIKKDFRTFYSAYNQYIGTVNGSGQGHPFEEQVREQWNGSNLGFVQTNYNKGTFLYTPDREGSVFYEIGGTTSTNCTFSGNGVVQLARYPTSFLIVDWKNENYSGTAGPSGHYPVLSSCDPDQPGQGPTNGFVFQTGLLAGQTTPLAYGSKVLEGTYADPFGIGPTSYSWSLAGS